MAAIDIDTLSLQELRELRDRIDQRVVAVQRSEKNKAREQIYEIAKNLGMSVQELIGSGGVKPAKTVKEPKHVEKKYRNPANASEEWTGRGRQPKWVETAVKGGKKLEDLLIK